MSDTDFQQRNGESVNLRSVKGTTETRRRSRPKLKHRISRPSTKPLEVFSRCGSMPALLGDEEGTGQLWLTAPNADQEVLFRPQTSCTDIFSTSDHSSVRRPPRNSLEGYKKDAKVVINVTVEGSPGPVRAMVKLGSTVEETIKLVVDRYTEEGRTPRLVKDDIPAFELHHSYFSLECLDRGDTIGDAGSRSFYLRKTGCFPSSNSCPDDILSDQQYSCLPIISFQGYVWKNISKIIRRTHKLWKLLGCVQ